MPEPTDAAKIEELGTTLYDRADEIGGIALLLGKVPLLPDFDNTTIGELQRFAGRLVCKLASLALRLNPNAAADSCERNGEPLVLTTTDRGFKRGEFVDFHGEACWMVKSSTLRGDAIWLGVGPHPMHLTRPMVAALLPHLRRFKETGEL